MPYGSVEAGFGMLQIPGQVKATGAGTGTSTGDTLYYDTAAHSWKKAIAAAKRPFGFNAELVVLTQSLNVLTNETTYTRGTTDDQTTMSVLVSGRITKYAEAGIKAGDLVMISSTGGHEHTHVMLWNGTDAKAILGRYVINVTQFHNANVKAPDTVADDLVKIDSPGVDVGNAPPA